MVLSAKTLLTQNSSQCESNPLSQVLAPIPFCHLSRSLCSIQYRVVGQRQLWDPSVLLPPFLLIASRKCVPVAALNCRRYRRVEMACKWVGGRTVSALPLPCNERVTLGSFDQRNNLVLEHLVQGSMEIKKAVRTRFVGRAKEVEPSGCWV